MKQKSEEQGWEETTGFTEGKCRQNAEAIEETEADEEKEEPNPYWGRMTLLDWYMNLGFRGKLRWVSGVCIVANGIAFLFGFFWPRMLFSAIGILLISFMIPSSVDD
jgi:hypothetical protein